MARHDRQAALRRRYLSLGLGEFAAAAVFAAIAALLLAPRLNDSDGAALWAALFPLLLVLVQAGAYWLLARRWLERGAMPAAFATVFRVLRVIDVVALGVGLAGLIVWWPDDPGVALGLTAVWLFGLIEYVNYFIVRLAYPPSRWLTSVVQWRTPRLMQDVRASRSA